MKDGQFSDSYMVSKAASTYSGAWGYVTVQLNALTNVVGDEAKQVNFDGFLHAADAIPDDGVPLFVWASASQELFLSHCMAKRSGKNVVSKAFMVFAINNGKADLNALNAKRDEGSGVIFTTMVMSKVAESPCDDYVKGSLGCGRPRRCQPS